MSDNENKDFNKGLDEAMKRMMPSVSIIERIEKSNPLSRINGLIPDYSSMFSSQVTDSIYDMSKYASLFKPQTSLWESIEKQMIPIQVQDSLANISKIYNEDPGRLTGKYLSSNPIADMLKDLGESMKPVSLIETNLGLDKRWPWLEISGSIKDVLNDLPGVQLDRFDGLASTINTLSEDYFKTFSGDKKHFGVEIRDAYHALSLASEEAFANEEAPTWESLIKFKDLVSAHFIRLLSDLSNSDSATRKNIKQIFALLGAISTIISLYMAYEYFLSPTSEDVMNHTDASIEKAKAEINQNTDERIAAATEEIIDSVYAGMYEIFSRYRVATRDAKLFIKPKGSPCKKPRITKGQKVIVIQVQHKWLYISYIDVSNGEPRSGYVYKKYFELTD